MVVYIEYAFLQNFLFDGALLWLAFRAARLPVKWGRLCLSASVGGGYALVFPLLTLPAILLQVLKWAVGLLLPLLAIGRVRTRKEWGRYALTASCFLFLTFLFGGAILGLAKPKNTLSFWAVLAFFVGLSACVLFVIEKFYRKREVERRIYVCKASFGGKTLFLRGFYDSGNLAAKGGIPVCFLSADAFYDLFGESLLNAAQGGQVRDELAISTLAGEKKLAACKGEIEIELRKGETRKRVVYFASSANMIDREYKILLNSRLIGGE